MHLCQVLNCPPGLGFPPPAIVPNITRLSLPCHAPRKQEPPFTNGRYHALAMCHLDYNRGQLRAHPGSEESEMFVVRRLQDLERQRKTPLYACFIDLQKAYDSVYRELLWARYSHPLAYQPRRKELSVISTMACGLAFVLMTASLRNNDLMSRRGCVKAVYYHGY